jgi:hypothetical protein
MTNCTADNNRYTTKHHDGLSAIDMFDQYLSFFNSNHINLNALDEEGHVILKEINKILENNKDLCEISIPSPSVLFQKHIYDGLGHFGVNYESVKSEQSYKSNHIIHSQSNNIIQYSDGYQVDSNIPIRDTWLEKNNNIIVWNDKNKNWAKAQYTCINQQGICGDCWANSATSCITIRLSILTGYYCPLDINQIMQCTYLDWYNIDSTTATITRGCHGGQPIVAMNYIANHGLSGRNYDNSIYPPKGNLSKSRCILTPDENNIDYTIYCKGQTIITNVDYNWDNYKGIIDSNQYYDSYSRYKDTLIKELNNGPVTVNIWSSGESITLSSKCYNWVKDAKVAEAAGVQVRTDHALLLVGYDKELQSDNSYNEYWIIQNSWGVHTGNNGFITVAAKSGNIEEGFTVDERRAFPFNLTTYCTPYFTKLPKYDKSYYQKCCPVCDDAFIKNVSCSAIDSLTNYGTDNVPIFPTTNYIDTVFVSTKAQECIKYYPAEGSPIITKDFTVTDLQNAYDDVSLTMETKLLPVTQKKVLYHHQTGKYYGINPYWMTGNFMKYGTDKWVPSLQTNDNNYNGFFNIDDLEKIQMILAILHNTNFRQVIKADQY